MTEYLTSGQLMEAVRKLGHEPGLFMRIARRLYKVINENTSDALV